MGTFTTRKMLNASPSLMPEMAKRITQYFESDGYQVESNSLPEGGYDISINKGGLFKSVLGMRSALKVSLKPSDDQVAFEAGIGIFGQQAIPTVITLFFFWPTIITQVWGMVKQSKLDDKALELAEQVINNPSGESTRRTTSDVTVKFCTACGSRNTASAKFCNNCGKPL